MKIIKTYKHISDNTGISKVKKCFGAEENATTWAAQGNSFAVMKQFRTLTVVVT